MDARFPAALLPGVWVGMVLAIANAAAAQSAPAIDFNRQVRLILSDNCFKCHGPDATHRQGGLRLDVPDAPLQPADSGSVPIVPGKPDESELVRRVFSTDSDEVMPPPDSDRRLEPEQKELLKTWIAQGARFQTHWSFVAPQRPPLPAVKDTAWPRNPVDSFILARLETEGLQPTREADRTTLIRRLTLDLTGLPPTLAEIDAFLADTSDQAYEQLVDRLLANPHFGERLALDWLDAARFADTHGFHIDSGRDMTRWREWVIDAFNNNKPFDQFTVEQLAGDLLPNATLDQKLATGFNRNHMINFEGGAIPQEYHNAYIIDRVNTTGAVWLGLTVACVQCHDHKYDPISQKEFYQLYAFFHNVPENGLDGSKGNAAPLIRVPSAEQQRQMDELAAAISKLEAELAGNSTEVQGLVAKLAELKEARTTLDKQIPTSMVMQEMAQPRDTFVLVRGQYDKFGEKVTSGVPAFLPPLPDGAPDNRLGLAQWLVRLQPPADRPRDRESILANDFRNGLGRDRPRFRIAGRTAEPSRVVGLAGGRVPDAGCGSVVGRRTRLERQGAGQADGHVGDVSSIVSGDARVAGQGSREPPVGSRAAAPAGGRIHPRPGVGGQRTAERADRRSQRIAVPAAWHLGGTRLASRRQELDGPGIRAKSRPGFVPPQHVYLLETHRAAALAGDLRRAGPRDVRGPPRPHEHAAAGVGADERSHLRRSLAETGRAGADRRRRDHRGSPCVCLPPGHGPLAA